MRIFTAAIAAFLMMSSTASADNHQPWPVEPVGYWELMVTRVDRANSPDSFRRLQTMHNDLLAHIDARFVTNAEVTSNIYNWNGASSCAANDPRLTHVSKSYSLCMDFGDGGMSCEASESPLPPMGLDPCANPPAQWTQTGVLQEETEERARIESIAAEFPHYFLGLSVETVTKVGLNLKIMQWEGATVCESDDPRLTKLVGKANICFEAVDVDVCTEASDAPIVNLDPCL